MKLPSYPKYKPSGVDWLGDVPDHWDVKALKRELSRSVSGGGLIKGNMASEPADDLFKGFSASGQDVWVDEAHYDAPGIVLSAVGARCGKAFKADCQWTAVANTHVFFPREGHSRDYLWYLLNNEEFWEKGGTAQPYVRVPATLNRSFTFAPPDEQQTIADFLDRETARLDTLVSKKRELIEKLKEKRTALISRTVTRGLSDETAAKAGLNPHPKLKPSGIELLGDIPVHWDVKPLRYVATRIQTGSTPPTAQEKYYEDGSVPWFGPGSFGDAIVLAQPVKLLNVDAINDGAARLFRKGATFVVTIGATLGKVSSIDEDASCNQQITVAEVKPPDAHPRFITYQLKRLEGTLRAIAPSATLPILSQGEIARLLLALPPAEEQRAIADYLDRETAKIDKMVEKVEAAIEKLQEYRTALDHRRRDRED